jgi:hypothetical protein
VSIRGDQSVGATVFKLAAVVALAAPLVPTVGQFIRAKSSFSVCRGLEKVVTHARVALGSVGRRCGDLNKCS